VLVNLGCAKSSEIATLVDTALAWDAVGGLAAVATAVAELKRVQADQDGATSATGAAAAAAAAVAAAATAAATAAASAAAASEVATAEEPVKEDVYAVREAQRAALTKVSLGVGHHNVRCAFGGNKRVA